MAKLTKSNWLKEGFRILSEFAQNKLRILYLCERLKVTRGSFYHHFSSMDNYISELMKEWERINTLDFIRISNKGKTPQERMELLAYQCSHANQSVETAIRSWSFYNEIVQQHLKKVDIVRMQFVQTIFEEMGDEEALAIQKAKLDYAILIGIQQLFPKISPEEMNQLFELQKSLLSRE